MISDWKRYDPNFETKVHRTKDCWLWTGAKGKGPYGMFSLGREKIKAHRASWIIHFGEIPEGMYVLHKCDVSLCVNPEHLFLGTHKNNMEDMVRKGRGCMKLTWDGVNRVRRLHATGKILIKTLAKIFSLNQTTVGRIVNNKTWKLKEANL